MLSLCHQPEVKHKLKGMVFREFLEIDVFSYSKTAECKTGTQAWRVYNTKLHFTLIVYYPLGKQVNSIYFVTLKR